jgi:hypothetical protein
LFFSFTFSPFYLFPTNVTQALSLETIKGEAGATPCEENTKTRNEHIHTWIRSLSQKKARNPYYKHSGAKATRAAAESIGCRVILVRTSIHPCVRFAHHSGLDAQIQIHSSFCLDPRFSRHRQCDRGVVPRTKHALNVGQRAKLSKKESLWTKMHFDNLLMKLFLKYEL